ncbi:unnamed protein product [Acanthosepion pharaonis]|uniref:Uncharacterized protein n=1 Tax=Acanthosepion pharaonis TaxID=158019 RepID=A0A812CDU5_ACAPH|nr:unnamed protein product [Sepia pharaonis]
MFTLKKKNDEECGFNFFLLSVTQHTQLQVTSSSSVLQLFSPRSELFSLPSEVNSSLCLPGLNCSACLACNFIACLACSSSAGLACSSSYLLQFFCLQPQLFCLSGLQFFGLSGLQLFCLSGLQFFGLSIYLMQYISISKPFLFISIYLSIYLSISESQSVHIER